MEGRIQGISCDGEKFVEARASGVHLFFSYGGLIAFLRCVALYIALLHYKRCASQSWGLSVTMIHKALKSFFGGPLFHGLP